MANRHYPQNEEVEVTLKFKVKLTHISNYHHLNDDDIAVIIKDFKEEIKEEIIGNVEGDYEQQEVSHMCDYVNYSIEEADEDN
mgnify:CR=1 FL=1